jgi:hypothetical protein
MKYKVLGYIKDASSFRTIEQWESFAETILNFQKMGYDTRGGNFRCVRMLECSLEEFKAFEQVVMSGFDYLLHDISRFDNVTMKNFFNFIEDFVNYRVWGLRKEFEDYFVNIDTLKFAFFYTRDDIEPYVLLSDEFTEQTYGTLHNPKELLHYTTENGLKNIIAALDSGNTFDISCFTVAERDFFREESNILIRLIGNVRAGFKSDVKSFAVDNGRRACNLYRLGYPGGASNLCYELQSCDGKNLTSLWNEYIATPIEIISVERR